MPYKKGSRAMPPVKTPQLLQRCVAGVSERFAADEGVSVDKGHVSRAFAICTAQGQKYGKYEPGTRTLTPRGRGLTSAVREDKRRDLRRYETVLQEARENIHQPTGAAMRRRSSGASSSDYTISAFDLFEDVEPIEYSKRQKARHEIDKRFNSPGQILAASTYIKPEAMQGVDDGIVYWRGMVWAIQTDAKTKEEALRIGKRVQRNLVGVRSLSVSDPYVHTLPMFVLYENGSVEMPAAGSKKKSSGEAMEDPSGLMARMENPSWWCPACRMRAGMNPARAASGAMPRVGDTSWWCPACQMRQMSVQPARAYGPSGAVSGPRVAAVASGGVVLGAAATYWRKKQGG